MAENNESQTKNETAAPQSVKELTGSGAAGTSSTPGTTSPLINKPTYNREKYLAEELRRGGETGSQKQSQQEMNKFLLKVKQELTAVGNPETNTIANEITAGSKQDASLPLSQRNFTVNPSPLEKTIQQMSIGSSGIAEDLGEASNGITIAGKTLDQEKKTIDAETAKLKQLNPSSSRALQELEFLRNQKSRRLPDIKIGSTSLEQSTVALPTSLNEAPRIPVKPVVKTVIDEKTSDTKVLARQPSSSQVDLSSIINELQRRIDESEAKESRQPREQTQALPTQHTNSSQDAIKVELQRKPLELDESQNGKSNLLFKYVTQAINFTDKSNRKKSRSPEDPLRRMQSHHSYQSAAVQNTKRLATIKNPQMVMPGTVIEQQSRDEYSQLDTPLSRLDALSQDGKPSLSIELDKGVSRIKTVESQGDNEERKSLEDLKNKAAGARAESALLQRTNPPLQPYTGQPKKGAQADEDDSSQAFSEYQDTISMPAKGLPDTAAQRGKDAEGPAYKRRQSNHFYVNDLKPIKVVKTKGNSPPKNVVFQKEGGIQKKINTILASPQDGGGGGTQFNRQNSNHFYVSDLNRNKPKAPSPITNKAFLIEQPTPQVIEQPKPPIIQFVTQPAKPLPPVIRRKETRIKFNYLKKRHNISPDRSPSSSSNRRIAQIIKERGSASTVTIEKILPNIYNSGSITEADYLDTTDPSATINSSMSRADGHSLPPRQKHHNQSALSLYHEPPGLNIQETNFNQNIDLNVSSFEPSRGLSLPMLNSQRSNQLVTERYDTSRQAPRSTLPGSVLNSNGIVNPIITYRTNSNAIPTTTNRKAGRKSYSTLKQRGKGNSAIKSASKKRKLSKGPDLRGEDKMLALENLYFRSNISHIQKRIEVQDLAKGLNKKNLSQFRAEK